MILQGRFSFLNRLFNINEGEWPRVLQLWAIRFLYRFGFVIGWTIITAVFVARFGISLLPYLFVVNALFIMSGSVIYVWLIQKIGRSSLIVSTIFSAGLLLFLATFLSVGQNFLFLLLLILAESLFLVQLNILFEDLIEGFFTALESSRTFPLIESADTVGGIFAGVTILSLAGSIASVKFVYIWLVSLFIIVPLILHFRSMKLDFGLSRHSKYLKDSTLSKRLSKAFTYVRKSGFLQALAATVFLHWVFVNLLEFQYTRAVYEHVAVSLPAEGSGFEHALVHDLGTLNILFYGSALVFQLFLGGRLISALGIVGSMLMYPIIMILSVLGLLLNYNFLTAVLAKNNFVLSGVVFKNSYLSSYYAVKEDVRSYVREFLEGFIHPIGALVGTAILLATQTLVSPGNIHFFISGLLAFFASVLLFLFLRMQRSYTEMSSFDLLHADNLEDAAAAVNVLAQKGHSNSQAVLTAVLLDPHLEKADDNLDLQLHILEVIKDFLNRDMIVELLSLLKSPEKKLRLATLKLIDSFDAWDDLQESNVFSNHSILSTLQSYFKRTNDVQAQILIMNILSKIAHFDSVSFILKLLKNSKKPRLLAACIGIARKFDDPHLLHYVKGFLRSKNNELKAQALVTSLYFAQDKEGKISEPLRGMLDSSVPAKIAILKAISRLDSAIYLFKDELIKLSSAKHVMVALYSNLCLGKIAYADAAENIFKLLFKHSEKVNPVVQDYFDELHPKVRARLRKAIHREASHKLSELIRLNDKTRAKIRVRTVDELQVLLSFLDTDSETHNIQSVLHKEFLPESDSA